MSREPKSVAAAVSTLCSPRLRAAAAGSAAGAAAAAAITGTGDRSPSLTGLRRRPGEWASRRMGLAVLCSSVCACVSASVSARGGGGGLAWGGESGGPPAPPTSPPVGLSTAPLVSTPSTSGLLPTRPLLVAWTSAAVLRGEGGCGVRIFPGDGGGGVPASGCGVRILAGELGAEQCISRDCDESWRGRNRLDLGAVGSSETAAEAAAVASWLAALFPPLFPRKVSQDGRPFLASLLARRFRSCGSHRLVRVRVRVGRGQD